MKITLIYFLILAGIFLWFVGMPVNYNAGNTFWVVYDFLIGIQSFYVAYIVRELN